MSLLTELEGTGEEVGGTLAEAPGFGLETLEKLHNLAGGNSESKLTRGTGANLKKAGGTAGSKAGKEAGEAAGKAANAVPEAIAEVEKFGLKVMLNSALLFVGVVLIIFGVMVAVKPADSAFSLPMPVPE